jgi:hypothetical protein
MAPDAAWSRFAALEMDFMQDKSTTYRAAQKISRSPPDEPSFRFFKGKGEVVTAHYQ